jgi:glutamate N-acetyltransferase/amino-acid N-acetyltransferase
VLDMGCVERGIHDAAASLSAGGGAVAAEAIRTTDAFAKLAATTVDLPGGPVRIGGMAKGAGMIRPDMATTLVQITTDADVAPDVLAGCLASATDASFNAISVDGSTSTNDCILVLANGASGVTVDADGAGAFEDALRTVLLDLATQVVADGEGASRYCRYEVTGAADARDARIAARAVGEDTLVRCALHGADPNWGRMLAALGASAAALDPARVQIDVGDVPLVRDGLGHPELEDAARTALEQPAVDVHIDLGLGDGTAVVYASDLSPTYVRLNAGSRT